jgi:hypothetical protein
MLPGEREKPSPDYALRVMKAKELQKLAEEFGIVGCHLQILMRSHGIEPNGLGSTSR